MEYEKKEKKECKYCRAYLGGHNSSSEVSNNHSKSEGDIDLEGDYYRLSLVPSKDSNEEVVTVPPVPPQAKHGRGSSEVDDLE